VAEPTASPASRLTLHDVITLTLIGYSPGPSTVCEDDDALTSSRFLYMTQSATLTVSKYGQIRAADSGCQPPALLINL
jgi:hypothetical protein